MFPREISFTNLQPNHTAVYQCEASNIHGTILASANIDVVGEHPCVLTSLTACWRKMLSYSHKDQLFTGVNVRICVHVVARGQPQVIFLRYTLSLFLGQCPSQVWNLWSSLGLLPVSIRDPPVFIPHWQDCTLVPFSFSIYLLNIGLCGGDTLLFVH